MFGFCKKISRVIMLIISFFVAYDNTFLSSIVLDSLDDEESIMRSIFHDERFDDEFDDINDTCKNVSRVRPDINYVIKKYEQECAGKKCLYYPAKNPKRLVISFGCAQKNVGSYNYFLWSWFWRSDENWKDTAYLFVADPYSQWYVGNGEKPFTSDYSEMIEFYIKKSGVDKHHVVCLGGSMGGYGALLYAILLGLGKAVVFWPQICVRLYPSMKDRIGDNCIDLDELCKVYEKVPYVSYFVGTKSNDQAMAYCFLDALKTKIGHVIFHHAEPSDHNLFSILKIDKNFVDREIEYIDSLVVPLKSVV